jgi:hypothetical protein
MEHNRSVRLMKKIDKVVKWRGVEALLIEHYETGTSSEGADAYLALMFCLRPGGKALLLQKWFRIPSDPELENQIYPVEYTKQNSCADGKVVSTQEMRDCRLFPIPRSE